MLKYSGKRSVMQVNNLTEGSKEYTSNVWHVCGSYHVMSDHNTLIDAGRDPAILETLEECRCGLGKRPVEQIILTHSHFDHAGVLSPLNSRYHPVLYAHPSSRIEGITPVSDRSRVTVGDQDCIIVFTPGHSDDSICILCEDEGILFSGDSPMRVYSSDGEFKEEYLKAFEFFVASDIKIIYPGHGVPLTVNVQHLMEESFRNIRKSRVV
jgi:endoribonuclease LACTB2